MKKNIILPIVSALLVGVIAICIAAGIRGTEVNGYITFCNDYILSRVHESMQSDMEIYWEEEIEIAKNHESYIKLMDDFFIMQDFPYKQAFFKDKAIIFLKITQTKYGDFIIKKICKKNGELKIVLKCQKEFYKNLYDRDDIYKWVRYREWKTYAIEILKSNLSGVKKIVTQIEEVEEYLYDAQLKYL